MKLRTLSLNPMALAIAIAFTASAHAAGTGTIVSGNGSINKTENHTVVKQDTDKMVINWDNMDVAQKDILQFVQPDKNSAVLNRVNSLDPTRINGALRANGQVFIVNPNGVLINSGASIDVGSLIASSLDIQDRDFIKGNLVFSGNGKGTVSNQGNVSAENAVALIGAGEVSNRGRITTANGDATLAAGENITLSFPSMGKINVKINKGSLRALVNNGGIIRTPNGSIALTAWATDTLTRSVINNTGTLEADQIVMRTDGVYLENIDSPHAGDITTSGSVKAKDIKIVASGSFHSDDLNVSNDLDISAKKNVNLGWKTTAGGDININADSIYASSPIISQGSTVLTAKENIIAGRILSGATYQANGAESDLSISAKNIVVSDIISRGKVKATAEKNITVNSVELAKDINLKAGESVKIKGKMQSNGNINIAAEGNVNLFEEVLADNDITISGNNINSTNLYWGIPEIAAGNDIKLTAKNNIDVNIVRAPGDYSVSSVGNIYLKGKSISAKGIASNAVTTVIASDSIKIDEVVARKLKLSAVNDIVVSLVAANHSVNAISTAGRIIFKYLGLTDHKNIIADKGVTVKYDENLTNLPESGLDENAGGIPEYTPPSVNDIPGYTPPSVSDIPGYTPPSVNDIPGYNPPGVNDMPEFITAEPLPGYNPNINSGYYPEMNPDYIYSHKPGLITGISNFMSGYNR